MRIYKKRKRINIIKQHIQRLAFLALAFIGLLSLIGQGIDRLQSLPLESSKTFILREAEAHTEEDPAPDLEAFLEYQQKAETIEEAIMRTFPENPAVMLAIAKAESGLNPQAINHNTNASIDVGIFQVNSIHLEDIEKMGGDMERLKDVSFNLQVARYIYELQGLEAWVAYKNKSYLRHL